MISTFRTLYTAEYVSVTACENNNVAEFVSAGHRNDEISVAFT